MRDISVDSLYNSLYDRVSIAPLVVFRIVLGIVLLYSTVRTYQEGWINELYVYPDFHFSFFSWIKPLDSAGMYKVFALLGFSAFCIILGLAYRLATGLFFILFLYCELIDITYYLNHYYLVSILVFWLALVPAHRWYSVDSIIFSSIKSRTCARWHILIFKVQLSIVYFFAGLAKVNSDWLLRAQPMATWLPAKYELPVLGSWMHLKETAYLFSWLGCVYDLSIWIFLWMKKTRSYAYILVVIFHVLTVILFPRIGMFPLIMIGSTIIFFSEQWHERLLSRLPLAEPFRSVSDERADTQPRKNTLLTLFLSSYLLLQLYLPLRHLQYPGNLFWHEQGYRFSWRVMLMEKNGYTSVILRDPRKNIQYEIDQSDHLTPFQIQQMRSQPDMLIQFARYIGDEFMREHDYAPEVYVKSRLSLNGRRSQVFTDEHMDLYATPNPMRAGFIIPLSERR